MSTLGSSDFLIEISLFGPGRVKVCGQDLTASLSKRALWLLSILAMVNGELVDRRGLIEILWPDSSDAGGLHNLRQTLARIRRRLGPAKACIVSSGKSLSLPITHGIYVDVLQFDRACESTDLPSLEKAVELYRNSLLVGCEEPFVFAERELRARRFLEVARALARIYLSKREFPRAELVIRRILSEDPFNDEACRGLMSSLAEQGRGVEALEFFRKFRARLRNEVRADASQESKKLYKSIHQQMVSPKATHEMKSNIPVPLSPLIGRLSEIEEVRELLSRCRLVTLCGPGGVGKTRLSIAVAEQERNRYLDGVWFVDFAPMRDADNIAPAIITALGIGERATSSPLQLIEEHIAAREMLIVLDNCEHLGDAVAPIIDRLLAKGERLHILATSRQSIGVRGELIAPVAPLGLPHHASTNEELARSESVRFFLDRASGKLGDGQLRTIASICRKLDGLPLAIELAAARTSVFSIAEIEKHLAKRFALLAGGPGALDRHRSLQASMEWSWEMLSTPERNLLMAISVFYGGCDLEAIHSVASCETDDLLPLLASLIDRSLVNSQRSNDRTRYVLLETVREFANEKLRASNDWELMNTRHRDYFIGWSEHRHQLLLGHVDPAVFQEFEMDHDNIRWAIEWGYAQGHREEVLRLCVAMARFWDTHGHIEEGRKHLEKALTFAHDVSGHIRGRALVHAGWMAFCQQDGEVAVKRYEEALPIYRGMDDERSLCIVLNGLATSYGVIGKFEEAEALFRESLVIVKRIATRWSSLVSLHSNLAEIALARGQFEKARCLIDEGMASMQNKPDYPETSGLMLTNLAFVEFRENRFQESLHHAREALHLFRDADLVVDFPVAVLTVGLAEWGLGNTDRAARLLGAFEKMVESQGLAPLSFFCRAHNEAVRCYRGNQVFEEGFARGREMGSSSAVALALA